MTTALRPEQLKAREYFEQKGTKLPAAQVHERVAAAVARLEAALEAVRCRCTGSRSSTGRRTR